MQTISQGYANKFARLQQLTDEQTRIQQQINAQFSLGRCYFEQARKVRDITEAKGLFAQATEHHQEHLKLAKQCGVVTISA